MKLPILLAAALAGCATQTAPPVADQPPTQGQTSVTDEPPVRGQTPGAQCSDANLQQFVGQAKSPDLEAQMLSASGAKTVRWVPPGTAITMEFRSDRLTVYLDDQNKVQRLSCS